MTELLLEITAAMAGTIAFSVLFDVPRRFNPYCGIIGGTGWAVYRAASLFSGAAASLAATMVVIFLSRLTAVWKHCPATVFLISGIFPLVPGAGVYWTAYYIVTDQLRMALETGYDAVKNAAAIVLGIVFVFEIPQQFFIFLVGEHRKKEKP